MLENEQLIKHVISFIVSVEIIILLRLKHSFEIRGKLTLFDIVTAHLSAFISCFLVGTCIIATDKKWLLTFYRPIVEITAFSSLVLVESIQDKFKINR